MANRSPAGSRLVWADRIDRFEQVVESVAPVLSAGGVSQASFYLFRCQLRDEGAVSIGGTAF